MSIKSGVIFLFISLLTSCASNLNVEDKDSNSNTVFICNGDYATKYHSDRNCRGLNNCKATISSKSVESAIDEGKGECSICW